MLRYRDIPEGVRRWIPPLAAILAAVAVFAPVLGFEFLEYDDPIYVFKSPLSAALSLSAFAEAFLAPYFRSYAPLTLLTHAVDLRVWGERAGLHHLVNLLLHAANVGMVYVVAKRLFEWGSDRPPVGNSTVASFTAALLFAVHPLQVEPVAWISGRKDVLMTSFLLGSFLAYLKWRDAGERGGRDGAGGPVLSTVLFILSLLSKSAAATFPLVLIVCDRLVLGRREGLAALVREKAGMMIAAAAAVAVALLAGRGYDTSDLLASFPPAVRVLLPFFTPVYYLRELIWPSGLTPFTPPPGMPWVFLGAGATVVVTAFLVRERHSGLLAAWLGFLLLLVPTIGGTFLETGMQPWADRFTYAPMIPVFLVAGLGISRISPAPARAAVIAALGLLLAFASREQLRHWRNTEAVWARVVHASPSLAKGYKNLASIRQSQGRVDEAIGLLRSAIALKPAYSEAHNDLGLALASAGRLEEALESHRTAIALDPTRVEGFNGYGIAMLRMGNARGAYEAFARGIDAHPESARLRFNAGAAALAARDTASAIARYQETVALDSTAAGAAERAAVLMEAVGDSGAATWYARAAAAGSAVAKAWCAARGPAGGQGVR